MFLGEYQHSIDPKGRLVLPAKFRDELVKGCVITKGLDRTVFVFSIPGWKKEEKRMKALPRDNRELRRYTRTLFSSADHQIPDNQGRVSISPIVREYAGLGDRVTLIGVAERIEIWNPERWQQESAEADDAYANIEEALTAYGI